MDNIAFVFSGQGAQYSGMGKELFEASEAAKNVFNIADEIRFDTSKQCFTASKEELSITQNTQPCVFCVDLAAAEALKEAGIKPRFIAGFSLGELAALAFAKFFSTQDAFSLVCKRAEYMQKAAEASEGAMAAVLKMSNEKVEELCLRYKDVYPVNYNCPGQLVVAGKKQSLLDFCKAASADGAKIIPLAVSGAFHSPLMEEASNRFSEELEKFNISKPIIPVFSNYTARPYEGDYRGLISAQIKNPVLWESIIRNMIDDGIDTFIEAGPGKTLCGIIKKINADVKIYNVENKQSLENTLRALKEGEGLC